VVGVESAGAVSRDAGSFGKSTLLRMVAGLERISDGRISIAGKVVNERKPKDRKTLRTLVLRMHLND
jgi:ABC-type polar amino acid transport system ATPase subunit